MKKIILISGAVFIALNLLFGLLLSSYDNFNLCFTTLVLAANTALLYLTNSIYNNSDAFNVSLALLIPITEFVEFLLALCSPEHIKDNWYVVASVLIFTITCLIVYTTWLVSNKINKKY